MIAGAAAAAILCLLGAIHLYWAAGGSFGKSATLPTANGKFVLHPTPLITVLVAIALFAMAALVLARLALWLIGAIFLLRAVGDFRYVGFFKRVRDSRFAKFDTLYYSPLCLLLASLILLSWVARASPCSVGFSRRLFTASLLYRRPCRDSGSSPRAIARLPDAPPPAT